MSEPAPPAVAQPAELDAVVAAARATGRLALDTEFVGERRYWALLCLVGVSADAPAPGEPAPTALIDPLDGDDPGALPELLADPDVEIVVHAGRQDVAILRRVWETEVRSIFDTQIAAAFAGHGAQLGYGRLVQAVLGEWLAKGETFARWDERPLRRKALDYARDDVAHLPPLADALQASLRERGRLEWAREECRWLETVSDERDPGEVFRRLPRVRSLKGADLAVVRELAAWRERLAADEDRAVRSVIGDQQLLELAQRRPQGRRELREIRGLHPRVIERRGAEILETLARGAGAEPLKLEEARSGDPGDAPLVSLAEAVVRARADEAGLAYELIASRDELGAVVRAARRGEPTPDVRTLRGWRADLVGEDLRGLLSGERGLSVVDGRLRLG